MGKTKLTNLAQALKLVDGLNEADRATLRDYLKPASKPRKAASKPKVPAPQVATAGGSNA